MIKFKSLPKDIEKRLAAAGEYLNNNKSVLFAYLFGGLAGKKASSLSDVDLAVYINEPADLATFKLDILGHLIQILKTDEIDLVILNQAPLPLAARVLQNKVVPADNQPFFRHKYESLILRKYFDFFKKEDYFFKRRYSIGG